MEKTTDETGETDGEWTYKDEGDSMDEDEVLLVVRETGCTVSAGGHGSH